MELASDAFIARLRGIFALPKPVVATVHQAGHPDIDEWPRMAVTEQNRDALPARVAEVLLTWLGPA
jgi:nucleoside-triphosphatase THEP1